jgi:hypothetical protein
MFDNSLSLVPRRSFSYIALATLVLTLAVQGQVFSQEQVAAGQDASQVKTKKGSFSVRATRRTPQTFTVKANEARVAEVANEFGRLLKATVTVSPLLEKAPLTVDFGGLTLEASLRLLAPRAYVDYELGGGMQQPKVVGIYLYAFNETPPARVAGIENNSEAFLVEGHTEEGTEEYEKEQEKEEQILKVSYEKNLLSVLAKKQPLSMVLFKVASELGVPLDMRYETSELVDIDFKNYPVDQAIRTLSPSVRFYYRTDLQNFEVQPLRIALVAPASLKS